MRKYDKNMRNILIKVLNENRRGYVAVLRSKFPEVFQFIFDSTHWADQPGRKTATRIWYIINELHSYPECKFDNSHEVTKDVYRLTDPRMDFCCLKCSLRSEGARKKFQKTSLEKYGTEHPLQSREVMSKIEATNLKRYGVKQVLSDPEVQKKSKESLTKHIAEDLSFRDRIAQTIKRTSLKNNGAECFTKTEKGKKTATQNLQKSLKKRMTSKMTNFFNNVLCKNTYVVPLFDADTWIAWHKDRDVALRWRCNECGRAFDSEIKHFKIGKSMTYARCQHCHPYRNKSSLEEKNLAKWLKSRFMSYDVVFNSEENFKVIGPFQIDILVKNRSTKKIVLGIEYDGARWHSLELGSTLFRQLSKTQRCESLGFPLVHIFDDEWRDENRNEKLKTHLENIIGGNAFAGVERDDVIELDRALFPKTLRPYGYSLENESEPDIIERKSITGETFHVPDCGKLTYRRTAL